MSRDEGFDVMDLDTSLFEDVKVKNLIRHAPDRAPMAITAYVALATASWRAGRRLTVEATWPVGLPFDRLAADALVHYRLVDKKGQIVVRTWRRWYETAFTRRAAARSRWSRSNANRTGNTARQPRGNSADTAHLTDRTVRPTDRTDRQSVPTEGERDVVVSDGARDVEPRRPLSVVHPA